MFDRGLKTGYEHASAVDLGKGIEFFRATTNKVSEIQFTNTQLGYLVDPKNNVELIHNHPSSSSLSLADMRVGSLPGVSRVVAVGHDGSVYSAATVAPRDRLVSAHRGVNDIVYSHLRPMIDAGDMSVADAEMMHGHLVNSALHRLGIINYQTEKRVTLTQVFARHDEQQLVDLIMGDYDG